MANEPQRNVFTRILEKGALAGIDKKSEDSRQWFRDTARRTKTSPMNFVREVDRSQFRSKSQLGIGFMYCYFYNPKGKEELPYYDRFPLIFMVGKTEDGFYGINLHYLPYKLRAILMDNLYEIASNKRFDETTKIKLSYNILQSASRYKYFKPCFKRYLWSHVQSRLIKINSDQWDMALFLPLHQFEKASANKVWADSTRKIKGR